MEAFFNISALLVFATNLEQFGIYIFTISSKHVLMEWTYNSNVNIKGNKGYRETILIKLSESPEQSSKIRNSSLNPAMYFFYYVILEFRRYWAPKLRSLSSLATLAPYISETPKWTNEKNYIAGCSDKFLIFEDYSGDSYNFIKIVSL